MLNLTPHAIVVRRQDGSEITYPPSGKVARVLTDELTITDYQGIPVISRTTREVEGVPEEGTPCLVSSMVLAEVPGRKGVYAPDTGPTAIRENGQVVAVTRLVAA